MKIIIPFLLLLNTALYSQKDSLFTEKNMVAFAQYLSNNKEYDLAAQEYRRLYFLYPQKNVYFKSMLHATRKAGNLEELKKYISLNEYTSPENRLIYGLTCISYNDFALARKSLKFEAKSLPPQLMHPSYQAQFGLDLLENKINKAPSFTDIDLPLQDFYHEYRKLPTKSPILAGSLSALMPGAGRLYTKDYKNGLISFLFIAGASYNSYLRFHRNGIKSPGGWIYGGMALGFYVGNIYGSAKSARLYNKRLKKGIDDKVKNYLNTLQF